MKSVLTEKYPDIKKVDYEKLLINYEFPTRKEGKIILNRNNPQHVGWIEDGEDEE